MPEPTIPASSSRNYNIPYNDFISDLEAIQKGNTKITQKIHSLLTQLISLENNCILQWIPASVWIGGNEMAVEFAKEARRLSQRKEQMSLFDHKIGQHTAEESANTKKQNGRRDDATFPKVIVKPLATAVGGRPPAVSPATDPPCAVNWADMMDDQDASLNPNPFTVVSRKRRRTSVHPRSSPAQSGNMTQKSANLSYNKPPVKRPLLAQQIKAT
ncbi:hypothetical protein LAZ67_12001908 [Cordylochernes scorpioides]|uniref:Uncharacterized protein n=1 Tax=Cordylochernes scorpioides TaxID=51811 RepID=A0ABY6L3C7_9ARAC|nr:hypothetical protein LAZ67_12001908 [Cordylochernes scorpioides]